MTKEEKKRLATVLRATEFLFLENIALKLLLEHRAVPNWQKLLDHLLADKEMLAGVRLKFSDFYREIESSADPSAALEESWENCPLRKRRTRFSSAKLTRSNHFFIRNRTHHGLRTWR